MEGLTGGAGAGEPAGAPSPYTRADLYDLLFHDYTADLDFYLGLARAAGGPALDVGCGTGRVLLRALEAGLDMDGLDASADMLARLEANAAARGLRPRVTLGDMRGFRMDRRACRPPGRRAPGRDRGLRLARCVSMVPGAVGRRPESSPVPRIGIACPGPPQRSPDPSGPGRIVP